MIRYAVGTVLMLYFLGADVFVRYHPPVLGPGLRTFHREINRGMWLVVGPGVTYYQQNFGSDGKTERKDSNSSGQK